jgi:ABC-type nitrate/sulfonate/bicarbonate transport system substrate-binding protein
VSGSRVGARVTDSGGTFMKYRHSARWAAALLLPGLAITACSSSSGGSSSGSSPATSDTTITYGLPTSSYDLTTVGIQFGISQGFFAKQHINVKVELLNSSTAPVRGVLSGAIQIGQTGADTAAVAIQSGAPLMVVSEPTPKEPGVTLGLPGITSLKDLVGKNFAISAPGGSSDTEIIAELTAAGVNPDAVHMIALGAPSARIAALLAGKVQGAGATILAIPDALNAVADHKLNVLARDADEFPDLPLAVNTVTSTYLASNKSLITRFLTAEMQGYRWAVANPAAAAAVAAKYVPDTPVSVLETGIKSMIQIHGYGTEPITNSQITATLNALLKSGTITKAIPLSQYADVSLVQAAAANAGS